MTLSWSILNGFSAIHSWNVYCSLNREKFKVMNVGSTNIDDLEFGTTRKLINSACYDKQQVCVYL